MASVDTHRGAKRAREARAALGLDPVAPLPCLLTVVEERLRLPVVVARLPDDVAGACWRDGDGMVLWVNGAHPAPRQRFTLAHEMGHAWCRHDGALAVESVQTLGGLTTNPLEIQANAFAAEFLLPKAGAGALFAHEPTLDEVVVVAAYYGVSAIVALFRLMAAEAISGRGAERLREEIDKGRHLAGRRRLGLPALGDRLSALAELPYTSPALEGSALAASLAGTVAVTAAAEAAGVAAERLRPALRTIGADAG